jgi:hypothetical protein
MHRWGVARTAFRTAVSKSIESEWGRKYDQAKKVYVYSDAALLPQDFEIVDAVSQRKPEA